MSQLKNPMLARALAVALTAVGPIAGAGALLFVTAAPAAAECKYGSGQCINPRPNFDYQYAAPPTLEGTINEWIDGDCRFYSNCGAPPQDDQDDEGEEEDRAGASNDAPRDAVVGNSVRATLLQRR